MALKADELKSTPVITAVATQPGTVSTSRSFIVTTGGTTTASAVPAASNSASTSRQNLDSIVEAIRHLEGDHLFSEDSHKVMYFHEIPLFAISKMAKNQFFNWEKL